ncbi:PaaI family thioesterase [Sporosarcina sp. P29]|uniref:PaaI family thioesterase n=1 Tax=Sporosarcina sp. P29 TaxID=2048252 RepID=UPI000C169D08|nr:PaaI family thioesterase [Sporosarcina sp. P29]PIC98885.1 phenylacetic acid degradation protein [Sporosarcina sp. P29]
MTQNEIFHIGEQALEAQSFSKLLGTNLLEFTTGEVVLEVPITEHVLQQHGFVHGGVISYAADNALTFVGGSVLGPNVLTAEYKINYVRPAIGEKIIARATVISAGKRQAVCRCDVFAVKDGEEKICATAQGTIMTVVSEQ